MASMRADPIPAKEGTRRNRQGSTSGGTLNETQTYASAASNKGLLQGKSERIKQLNPNAVSFFPIPESPSMVLSSSSETENHVFSFSPTSNGGHSGGGGQLERVQDPTQPQVLGPGESPSASRAPVGAVKGRTLFLANVPMTIADGDIWMWCEKYGDLRGVDSRNRASGCVFVSFYDIRHAERAAEGLSGIGQNSTPIAFYVDYAPTPNSIQDGMCDCLSIAGLQLELQALKDQLAKFGEVMSITSNDRTASSVLVEFYDVRHTAGALQELSQSSALGSQVKVTAAQQSHARLGRFAPRSSIESSESPVHVPNPQEPVVSVMPDAMYPPQYMSMAMAPVGSVESVAPFWVQQWQGMGPMNMYGPLDPMVPLTPDLASSPPMQFATSPPHHPGAFMYHTGSQVFSPPSQSRYSGGRGSKASRSGGRHRGLSDGDRRDEGRQGRGGSKVKSKAELEEEEKYAFREESSGGDTRTTVMMRNIPNKYNQAMLLDILNAKYKGDYDFFYLPIDFTNKCNLGYAFVNFLDSARVTDFYREFHNYKWGDFNSKKVCKVTYARVQGRAALLEHFKDSKFPCDDLSCLPLVFETLEGEEEGSIRVTPIHLLSH